MSSLFERLSTAMPSFQPKFRQELAGRRIDTIKRHLETLLNARQGCSQSSPGLGLPDFNGNHMASGDLLIQVSADIRRAIQRYEPRIRVQTLHAVRDVNAPLDLLFRLDCQVQIDSRAEQMRLELLINSHNRHARVR